jgi:PAS domain S-box-containing protein
VDLAPPRPTHCNRRYCVMIRGAKLSGRSDKENHPAVAQTGPGNPSKLQPSGDLAWSSSAIAKLTSPKRTLIVTSIGIFLAEVAAMVVVYVLRPSSYAVETLLDASIITALVFPLVFFLSFRSLVAHIETGEQREQVLEKTVARLQELELIVDQSPAVAFLWRNAPGWPVEFVSNNIQQYGYRPDEFLSGKIDYAAIIHPEDLERVVTEVARNAREGRTDYVQEYRIVTRSGDVRWVDDRTWVRQDDAGTITHHQGIVIDISDRKRAEAELVAERQRLFNLLDQIPAYIYLVAPDSSVLFANSQFRERFGDPEGKRCYQLLFDQEQPCRDCATFEVIDTKRANAWERTFSDGTVHQVHDYPFTDIDGSLLVLQLAIDITERKQAREQLEQNNRALQALSVAEQQQRQLVEGLVQAAIALNSSLDLDQVLNRILEQIQTVIPCVAAAVALVEDGVIRVARARGFERDLYPLEAQITRLPFNAVAPLVASAETGEPIHVMDTHLAPDSWLVPGFEWVRSYVAVPLQIDERAFGFQCVLSDQPDGFGEDVIEQLMAFATHAVVAIQNARLYRAESQARVMAETLSDAVRVLTQTLHLETVMNAMLEYLERLVPYDSASVALLEGDSRLVVRAVRGYEGWTRPEQILGTTLDVEADGSLRMLLSERQSVIIRDAQRDPAWMPRPGMEHVLSWLGVPLAVGGKVLGVCGLDKSVARFFTQEHAKLVAMLVSHAAAAVQNAWLFEEVLAGRERLQYLSRRLVEVQESERRYIARELHDEAGQLLSSLKLGLRFVEQDPGCSAEMTEKLGALKEITDGVLDSLHRLAMDLRPASLDHVGLVAALHQYTKSMPDDKLLVQFKAVGFDEERLPTFVETALYRIVQEALVNVVRHARAGHLGLLLERRHGQIRVYVEDDGVGFDPHNVEGSHLGLLGMRERVEMLGGTLLVESTMGNGTSVIVEVPDVYPRTDRR